MRRVAAVVLGVLAGCASPAAVPGVPAARAEERHDYHRVIMGSPCDLVVWAPDAATADAGARAAFARLGQVDEALSDWMRASEVRRLPARAGTPVAIGPDLRAAQAVVDADHEDRRHEQREPEDGGDRDQERVCCNDERER